MSVGGLIDNHLCRSSLYAKKGQFITTAAQSDSRSLTRRTHIRGISVTSHQLITHNTLRHYGHFRRLIHHWAATDCGLTVAATKEICLATNKIIMPSNP